MSRDSAAPGLQKEVEVCVDPFGSGRPVRLCRDCSGARSRARTNTVVVVGTSVEAGSRCEDCGATNRVPAGVPYLLGVFFDDRGEGPLGGVFMERLELPFKTYAEVAGRVVTFPDERSVLRWAHKQFVGFEIGFL